MERLLCSSFFCHLHVRSCVSLPTCHCKKYTAASAQCSPLWNVSLYLIPPLPAAPPPGYVLPRRVSTVTSRIWSTVNTASHSSWIIKQRFFYSCSHVWSSKSPHEYSAGFEDREVMCTITISSGRMSEPWRSNGTNRDANVLLIFKKNATWPILWVYSPNKRILSGTVTYNRNPSWI